MVKSDCEMQIENILEKENEVHVMSNLPLAQEIIKELEQRIKSPIMIQAKGWQFIAVTKIAKRKLSSRLNEMRRQDIKEAKELEQNVKQIWDTL